MKTIKTILSVTVLAVLATACGNGNKTPDMNFAPQGFAGTNPGGNGGGTGSNTGGNGASYQCNGAVNIRNVFQDASHEYIACRSAQGLALKPSNNNFNDAVCVFYAQNGNPLFNSNQGTFVYQCLNLPGSGQTLNAQGFNYNSIYVARSEDSAALYNCFQVAANNRAISIRDCAAYYQFSFAIGGL